MFVLERSEKKIVLHCLHKVQPRVQIYQTKRSNCYSQDKALKTRKRSMHLVLARAVVLAKAESKIHKQKKIPDVTSQKHMQIERERESKREREREMNHMWITPLDTYRVPTITRSTGCNSDAKNKRHCYSTGLS